MGFSSGKPEVGAAALRGTRAPEEPEGGRGSRSAAAAARSPLPASVAGRLPRLPGSPSSGRGAGCSAVAAGGRRGRSLRARNAGCSFSKRPCPVPPVPAVRRELAGLDSAASAGIHESCGENPTVPGPQPCPLKYAGFIKAVKSDFKKPRLWRVALDLGLMNKIQKQNKGCFHNGRREREPVQLQNLDPGTEGAFVCETCGKGWQRLWEIQYSPSS